ncbi:CoA pyrophosphatase [Antarcticimicrobium sediminis]|uniref:CoA pyrophosphatase n=1 Tax=Antarcticimicrobium sediminis TaxID=2546227 RepID=A0A4R5EQV1_9RHOB|nr:CoA pyrophosphatase [Antarcticimicrobium sediminis]TDE37022.1 CoA pyrophosphatase [Antarcticimicrobium sediminis]
MRDPIDILQAALARPGAETSDFELNPGFLPPAGRKLRPAGVLVPVSLVGSEPRLILTKRSSALRHHPGQIAFPGGKQEEADADVTATALREAEEEIGLPRGLPKILGHLSEHETGTGFKVTPVLAVLERAFDPVSEPGEVEDVFSVPLAHVLNPENYLIESRQWQGGRRYYFTVPCGPYYIWGATARMLRGLALRAQA